MTPGESSPLAGVRVLDLSSTFMGPYCTALLAQWGADVVKVEPPQGDVLRFVGDAQQIGLGPVFVNANRGKRSIVLDLKDEVSRAILDRLVETADVLVHNMRPSTAERLGVTAQRLLALNDRLVLCALRGFGAGGRYQDRAAYDDVIQAASGVAAVQGGASSQPTYIRMSAADKTMGVFGAAAVLAALHGRQGTGRGRAIEVPMFETMAAFTLLEQQGGMVYDPQRGPVGYPRTESPHRRPYRTKDGYLAVMIYTDAQWHAFFAAIERPELVTDPRFRTIRERTLHTDELYALMDEHLVERTSAEWEELLGRADISTGPVNSIPGLFEDPHLQETGFFERVEHEAAGTLWLARPPVDMGDRDMLSLRPPPMLGEHTEEIMRELGNDETAADGLVDKTRQKRR